MTARGVVAMANTSPIVAAALAALSAFHVTHVDVAISLLGCWRRRDELSTDDWTAVLAHYGGPTRRDDAVRGAYEDLPEVDTVEIPIGGPATVLRLIR
jgi:hypothetical protein